MPTKAEMISELSNRTAERVKNEWPSFLNTAGAMYKYPFSDQLLIYAQRPRAAACAEFDFWNERMKRRIKSGSKPTQKH